MKFAHPEPVEGPFESSELILKQPLVPQVDPIRILILSSDQLSRAGLASLLGEQTGVLVTGQVQGDEGLPQLLAAYAPTVLVWDVAWETNVAIENIASIAEESPPILALAATESQAEQARSAGARGLLSRGATGEAIVAALRALEQGLRVADPVVASSASIPAVPSTGPELTPRELEVLRLLAEGLPNKGLASRLGVSEHTVKFHVTSIMGKLSAQSRTEAVTRATRMGLLPL